MPFKEICTESTCCSLLLSSQKGCLFTGVDRQQGKRLIIKTLVVLYKAEVGDNVSTTNTIGIGGTTWLLGQAVRTNQCFFLRGVFLVKEL